jgi:hypothetical protein
MTRKGVFVEGGLLDGERQSQSLVFGKELGWTGLIFDMHPYNKDFVLRKRRYLQMLTQIFASNNGA